MLRIITIDSATEPKIVLQGRLIGPWIGEVETVWEEIRRRLGNRHLIVDLKDVTLIDDSANSLLARMSEDGAELITSGVANRWLIKTLKEGKTPVVVRALLPNTVGLAHTEDVECNEVTTIARGVVTLSELRAHMRRERRDSALPYRELIDARGAVVKFSPAEVQEIVELLRSLSRSHCLGRTAVVVSTDVAYGIMRMLQVLVEDTCVMQPFRDVAAAELWLRG